VPRPATVAGRAVSFQPDKALADTFSFLSIALRTAAWISNAFSFSLCWRQIYPSSAVKAMRVPLKKSPHLRCAPGRIFLRQPCSARPPRKYSASIKGQMRVFAEWDFG